MTRRRQCGSTPCGGIYRCYGCGIRGNSWTYLTRIRGLQPQAAKALLAELGWPEELFRWSRDRHEEQERVKSGAAKYMDEPCMTVGGRDGVPLARAIAQHVYRLADGRLVCVRYRYEAIHRRIPKCLTFTPSHRGGWWEALPNSTAVPTEDRHAGELPLYRLPELLEAIEGNDREIWIVADERCVDAVLALPDLRTFPRTERSPSHACSATTGENPENAISRRCGAEGAF